MRQAFAGLLWSKQFYNYVVRDWLDGERYTMADIVLLKTIDFAAFIGMPMPDDLPNLAAWHARASARPSAQA